MDPSLLKYYNRELQHVREVGAEFAREYPKIAGRLGLDEFECLDPYVERLFEGFAFLAARVQLKIDAEFPRFTQHLLEAVYPHYLAPMPSMAIAKLEPDAFEGSLLQGFTVPRGTPLRANLSKGEQTACEYRSAHEVTLWPIHLIEAQYLANPSAIANLGININPKASGWSRVSGIKAGLRLSFQLPEGLRFKQLPLDQLTLFLRGTGDLPFRLYEQLLANTVAVAAQGGGGADIWTEILETSSIRHMGFEENEALLPGESRLFEGYRLLREYFAFPERFLFVEISGLREAVNRCDTNRLDLIVLLDRSDPQLANAVDAGNFGLYCTPIINLFPKRADRFEISPLLSEYHIVPDRTRPLDFEVYGICGVTGFGTNREQEFLPFYGSKSGYRKLHETAYYSLRRERRVQSTKQRRHGMKTSYIGSEVFIALVDADEAPYRTDLRQLGLDTLCTNRDLPLVMPVGIGSTDFTLQSGAPVKSIRCLAGPTKPRASVAEGRTAWRLINHLSLNYLSLADSNAHEGAAALRELLALYGDQGDPAIHRQIEGVLSIKARPAVRRILKRMSAAGNSKPRFDPIVFGRGLEIALEFDESAFEGSGFFMLGAVLEQFFARYASINSFTETSIHTTDRKEVMRWPPRIGQRRTL